MNVALTSMRIQSTISLDSRADDDTVSAVPLVRPSTTDISDCLNPTNNRGDDLEVAPTYLDTDNQSLRGRDTQESATI